MCSYHKIIRISHQDDSRVISEVVLNHLVHPVQRHVGQRRRYRAPLGSPLFGGEQFSIEDVTCLQELRQYTLLHWDVLHQPFMADMIEAAFDIAF